MNKLYYHGTPFKLNGDALRAGSYVSPSYNIAYAMGMYNENTGHTWTDDDLNSPYNFEGLPDFKNPEDFRGIPTIYSFKIEDRDLNKLDNPYEHVTLVDISINNHQ